MNELIKELAEQCRWQEIVVEDGMEWIHAHFLEAKFAELIVQECLDKISGLVIPEEAIQPVGSYEKWNQALGHARLEIEQHFFEVDK